MVGQSDDIKFCIVIPCYNEEKKFLLQEYIHFLEEYSQVLLCFVNDGSTDHTIKLLTTLQEKFPKQVQLVSYKTNKGKAEAVRKGVIYSCSKFNFPYISYLDADLAVSLEECYSLTEHLNNDITFCFGSRILKIGSTIERKRLRFIIGRVIATIISEILTLKVYDTQCGCKLFTKKQAVQLFATPFLSRWLFDVELFFRMMRQFGKEKALTKMIEIPLVKWQDKGDSKVKLTYFFRLFMDLNQIRNEYKDVKNIRRIYT